MVCAEKMKESGPMIQEKGLILNSKLGGSDDFKASSGWLEKFKIRHGIRQLNIEGEKLSGNVAEVDSFVSKIEDLIRDENLSPDQIYNCDETGLYWKALPEKTLAAANETSAPGRKRMKDWVTVLACSNASGSHKLELAVVGKNWLNCDMEDAGFQLLNDEDLIAEVRNSPKEDDEDENDSGTNKISNNDAFESFAKGLAWLEQQEQCDSSELMILRKLRDRAARQRTAKLHQMKLPFKPL
ncbi:jerky protein homolog-like [Uloborus diversus]|uniref:jerky protein homolog-like n=1 Tax=Uloborus diversus TaxID=327109 RepID=UPI00240A8C17|nr:jerky protein homolog-like [Uloborus diversus]